MSLTPELYSQMQVIFGESSHNPSYCACVLCIPAPSKAASKQRTLAAQKQRITTHINVQKSSKASAGKVDYLVTVREVGDDEDDYHTAVRQAAGIDTPMKKSMKKADRSVEGYLRDLVTGRRK